ncbi:MAG TPA: type II CAAX endopeptidase family protein [Planctomycetota bacterium]|nr:type II CAAX endopeptidase family protein [Planctomycetota bacterium]HQA99569.1 type II CAAX endopeptidase family protein [Planctomycetota bacterium]
MKFLAQYIPYFDFQILQQNKIQLFFLIVCTAILLVETTRFTKYILQKHTQTFQAIPRSTNRFFSCILLYFILHTLLFYPIIRLYPQIKDNIFLQMIVFEIFQIMYCLLLFYIIQGHPEFKLIHSGIQKTNFTTIFNATISYFTYLPWYFVIIAITYLLFAYFQIPIFEQEIAEHIKTSTDWNLFFAILMVLIFAPWIEEYIYRVFLYSELRNYLSPTKAILLTAIIFTLVHQNIFAALPIFTLALFLTITYEKTQNYFIVVTIHTMHNLLTLLYTYASNTL